jgi:hypothetical protein
MPKYKTFCLSCENSEILDKPVNGWLCEDCRSTPNSYTPVDLEKSENVESEIARLDETIEQVRVDALRNVSAVKAHSDNRIDQVSRRLSDAELKILEQRQMIRNLDDSFAASIRGVHARIEKLEGMDKATGVTCRELLERIQKVEGWLHAQSQLIQKLEQREWHA